MAGRDGPVASRRSRGSGGRSASSRTSSRRGSCRTDPEFIDKVRDVVGLYMSPPEHALVLAVDEKSQIQALDRTAPCLPMLPTTPARMTHDYVRHGTTSLFAAFDLASGSVIAQPYRRHRHQEFLRFLKLIDAAVPKDLDLHLVLDNYATHKTPAIKEWLLKHPRFHLHFTPTSSQLAEPGRALVRRAHQPQAPPVSPPQRHRARRPTSASGSTSGTRTPSRSCGPRPPTRSWKPSPPTANESSTQDTSSAHDRRPLTANLPLRAHVRLSSGGSTPSHGSSAHCWVAMYTGSAAPGRSNRVAGRSVIRMGSHSWPGTLSNTTSTQSPRATIPRACSSATGSIVASTADSCPRLAERDQRI